MPLDRPFRAPLAALAGGVVVFVTTLTLQASLSETTAALLVAGAVAAAAWLADRRLLAPLRARVGELERRLGAVVESGGLLVWTTGLDGCLRVVPEEWQRYTGQGQAEAAGLGWRKALHPDDDATLWARWQDSSATGESYSQPVRLWHAESGRWRWNLDRGRLLGSENGETIWLGVLIDIDDHRRAEAALQVSEARYRELVGRSRDGIWRMEFEPPVPLDLPEAELVARYLRDGRVAECNDAFARCYGHRHAADMLGVSNAEMLPQDQPDNVEFVRELVRSGFSLPSRSTLEPASDGTRRMMEATITGIVHDRMLVGAWGIQRNVTEERAARTALERQQRLLETVLDTVPVGLSVKDAERRYIYANRSVMARFGWADESGFRGRKLEDVVQSPHARHMQVLDDEVFDRGVTLRNVRDSIFDAAMGEQRILMLNKTPIFDEDGRINGVVSCAVDVTELERARQALERSERRWRRLFEMAPVSMELFDANGDYVEGNTASHELFGSPTPDARQPNILAEVSQLEPANPDALRGGAAWRWSGWYDFAHLDRLGVDRRGRDGQRYLESVVAPLPADDGGVSGYLGICRDDTARKLSEVALVAGEERYRRFLEQSHEGIWRVEFDPPVPLDLPLDEQLRRYRRDGRLAECNDALARHYGCADAGELIEWLGGDPGAAREADYAETILAADHRVRDACITSRSRDGARVQLRLNAVGEVVAGALVREWGIGQDVTAELAAERERAEERALLTAILQSVPVGITLKDTERRYTYVNRWMCETWGLDPEAVLGRRLEALELAEDTEDLARQDRRVLEGRDVSAGSRHVLVRAGDRASVPVLVYKTPLRDAEGRVSGVLSALLDVTEQEHANRALDEQRAVLQAVLDTAPVSITVKDAEARYEYVNRRAREVSGWGEREVVGFTAADIDNPVYGEPVLDLDQEVLRSGEPRLGVEVGTLTPVSGTPRVLSLNKSALRDRNGRVTGLVSCTMDVTAEKAAEQALEAQRALFQSVLDALPIGVGLRDRERAIYMNRWWRERFCTNLDEVGCDGFAAGVPEDHRERMQALDRLVLQTGDSLHDMDAPIFAVGGGEPRHGLMSKVPLHGADGAVQSILSCTVDITDRREAEAALADSERRYRLLYDDNPSMFFTVDADGWLRQVNRFGAQQLGYTVEELVGRSMESLHEGEDREDMRQNLRACLDDPGRTHRWEVRRLRLDGSAMWVRETARAVSGEHGERLVLTVCEDISEARTLSERLSWQATHDQLTGLVNRREFEHRLALALESARGAGLSHTVAYLDLDQFKVINDTCGHVAGDELLRQLGALFEGCVRRQDTLARLGGDEFGLLMNDCGLGAGERVCEGLRRALDEFRFSWEGRPFRVGTSIGLVAVDGATAGVADVLSAADAACYAAKDSGRNSIHVYRRDDAELERRRGEMRWVSRLDSAMAERRLHLVCQRIHGLGGEYQGEHYELLLRMRDENGASVSPGEFLPAAERYGLANRLDRYVVATAAEWLGARPAHLARLYRCCINLSGLSLSSEDFADYVRDTFASAGVALTHICFEITETAAIANLAHAMRFIDRLRAEGCTFALDDFGSGLSSFAYLKQLKVEFLKIDGMFVRDMATDAMDAAMVRSINEIGHLMGMRTVAECVETVEALERLREVGVDYAQGYHLGRPMPLDELE